MRRIVVTTLVLASCAGAAPHARTEDARSAWATWRAARREELAGPEGWLSLVGLFWLEPGSHTLGSAPDAELSLPSGPPWVGTIRYAEDVRFVPEGGGPEVVLVPEGEALSIGPLRLLLIARGDRLALRVRDVNNPARESFAGLPVYDYDPAWRVPAHVRRPDPPRMLPLVNVLGMAVDEPCAAVLELSIAGAAATLSATAAGDTPGEGYFVMLRDATSDLGETYPAGRYLDVGAEDASGQTWVDFNYLHTPPCAYTSLATCPLPPAENVIATPIRAGERYERRE